MSKSLPDLIRLAIEMTEEALVEAEPGTDTCLALDEALSTLETALRQCPAEE